MSRTSALEDGFPCGTREDWLNAEHVHIKLTAHSANVPAEFTWHPPEPCASLHSLPRAGPSLREPLPEIDERGDHSVQVVQLYATPSNLRPTFPDIPTFRPKPCNPAQNLH